MRRASSVKSTAAVVKAQLDNTAYDIVKLVSTNISLLTALSLELENGAFTAAEAVAAEPLRSAILTTAGMDATITSVVTDKATIDSIFADKVTLDSLFTDKIALDSLYVDKIALDTIFADLAKGIGTNTALDSSILNALTNANQTIADAAQVAADLVATNQDTIDTAADKVATALDVIASAGSASTASTKATEASGSAATSTSQATISTTQAGLSATSATASQLAAWEAEATKLTADSRANELEDILVKIYTSVGNGTFTFVNSTEYSAFHWAKKSEAALSGALTYKGLWDASGGVYPSTPALGFFYRISVAGTIDTISYSVNDTITYNGTSWDHGANVESVTSVAGRLGDVVVNKNDVLLGNVDNTADLNKPVSTATATALAGKVDDAQVLTNVPLGAVFTDTAATKVDIDALGINASTLDGKDSTEFLSAGSEVTAIANMDDLTLPAGSYRVDTNTTLGTKPTTYGTLYVGLYDKFYPNQLFQAGEDTSRLFTRRYDGVAWQPWNVQWSSANDGVGSGLDAALLNGKSVINSVFSTDITAPAAAAAVKLAYDTGNHAHPYLGLTAKAADSNLLDGFNSDGFVRHTTNTNKTLWDTATSSGTNSSYTGAAFQVREYNHAGAGTGSSAEAPRIGFHWGSRVASQIGMSTDGTIRTYDNPGSGYEDFAALRLHSTIASGTAPLSVASTTVVPNLNVSYLNGYPGASAPTANTHALRDTSADINARLFRSTHLEQTIAPAATADICFRNDNTSDTYMRFMTRDAARSYLGIAEGSIGARCRFDGVLGVSQLANFGFSSITRTGVGTYAFVFSTARASAHYSVFGMGTSIGTTHRQFALVSAQTTSGFTASFNSHVSNIVGSLNVYDTSFANIIVIES